MRIELGSFVLSDEVSLARPRDGNKRLAEKKSQDLSSSFRVLQGIDLKGLDHVSVYSKRKRTST